MSTVKFPKGNQDHRTSITSSNVIQIIHLNKQTSFTNVQIEHLLKLQLINKEPQQCVS